MFVISRPPRRITQNGVGGIQSRELARAIRRVGNQHLLSQDFEGGLHHFRTRSWAYLQGVVVVICSGHGRIQSNSTAVTTRVIPPMRGGTACVFG